MRPTVSRDIVYARLARLSGLAMVVLCVLFQRRGLMHWTELLFLGLCIGLQETFLRKDSLRRWRGPMLMAYSALPLMLVLYHSATIQQYEGDFVRIVLYTPLPLVLVSVQIMVLYVRESARLVSVVLVLALFSTVIGVRRPLDDAVWPWLAGISVLATLFLMLQHPGMLFHGVYLSRRKGLPAPTGRPGGIMRNAFYAVMPVFMLTVLATSVLLYFAMPRLKFEPTGGAHEVAREVEPERPGLGAGLPGPPSAPDRPERTGPATISGLSTGVDLGDFGEIKRLQVPALNIERIEPADAPIEALYLRAFTYATFDGRGWAPLPASSSLVLDVPHGVRRELPGAPVPSGRGWARRRYRIEMLEAGLGEAGQMPLPAEPVAIENYGEVLRYNAESHILMAPLMRTGDSYGVETAELILSEGQMKAALRGQGAVLHPRSEYLQMPEGMKQQIRERFQFYERQRVIAEGTDRSVPVNEKGVYVCALDIVRMFHEATVSGGGEKAWVYSLETRPDPGADAIVRFLDTSTAEAQRFGHCEYFATAMCMLLRSFDVPCRLCAGFHAVGDGDRGLVEVTAASAHAWVEVYFDGFGWVAFDPTPEDETAENDGSPADPEAASDVVEDEPEETTEDETIDDEDEPTGARVDKEGDWFDRFDEDDQRRLFEGTGEFFKKVWRRVEGVLAAATAWMPGVLPSGGLLRTLLLLSPLWVVLVLVLRFRRKRKKMEARVLMQMGEGGRERGRGLYFQLLMELARYGFQKRPSETPREFAERVMHKGGGRHGPIRELTELYYELRFGRNAELEGEFKRKLAKYAEALSREGDAPPRPA